jgi:ferredoxin-NADP reductase
MGAKLTKREQIADATYAFTIEPNAPPFAYRAGQTIDLTYPGLSKPDAAGNRRTFSIANAPGFGGLLVATRDRGSALKRGLVEAPIGIDLEVDGPYGSFTLPQKPAEVFLIAGGIGVTPFRAMVEDTLERSLDHTLSLIHSNRTPEEAPFLEELIRWGARSAREMDEAVASGKRGSHRARSEIAVRDTEAGTAASRRPPFRYIPTMTQPERSVRGWNGDRRRVSPEFLDELLPLARNTAIYYVAGPPRFVEGSVASLKALGMDEDQIRSEDFQGY